jgi:hypothetical protein
MKNALFNLADTIEPGTDNRTDSPNTSFQVTQKQDRVSASRVCEQQSTPYLPVRLKQPTNGSVVDNGYYNNPYSKQDLDYLTGYGDQDIQTNLHHSLRQSGPSTPPSTKEAPKTQIPAVGDN